MALELNRMLEHFLDENSAREVRPTYTGPNAFLKDVVTPLYNIVAAVCYIPFSLC